MPHEPAVPGGGEVERQRGDLAQLAFQWHVRIYFLVNLFLIGIWAITSGFGYFWPIWPIMGWGLGLAVHGIATYSFPNRR
jgi:2TM domain-containing protein